VGAGRQPAAASDVDIYTQAQMDLGATVHPRPPGLRALPGGRRCVALRDGRVGELPTPRPKKWSANGRALCGDPGRRCRAAGAPPAGRHLGRPAEPAGAARGRGHRPWVATRFGLRVRKVERLAGFRHVFTHFTLNLQPELVDVATPGACNGPLLWQPLDRLDGSPARPGAQAAAAAYPARPARRGGLKACGVEFIGDVRVRYVNTAPGRHAGLGEPCLSGVKRFSDFT
jgi:adenine-specific DNA glycosylase